MKTINLFFKAALSVLLVTFMACSKDENLSTSEKSSFTVKMTDAPANYASFNAEITKVSAFNSESSSWVELNGETSSFDVLELRNGQTIELATNENVEAGTYTMLKIEFGNANSVRLHSSSNASSDMFAAENEFELTFKDESKKEIIIEIDQKIDADHNGEILLDFNVATSIEKQAGEEESYTLNPDIKVLATEENTVEGHVDGDQPVVVYISNGTEVRSTYPDENGNYAFIGVEAGNYSLTVEGMNEAQGEVVVEFVANIEVGVETTSTINIKL